MRDFKSMKRQRSRNRGGGGGGGKPQHNANRAFDSNGPDGVKIRGNAQHVFEKYQQLARDAASSGDRVLAENYLQHAEHYFRVLRAVQPQRPASEIIGRDAFASGIDIDFEDESVPEVVEGEAPAEGVQAEEGGEPRQDQPRGENGRQDYRDRDRGEYREGRRPDYRRDEYREGRRDDRQEGRRDDRPDRDRPERDRQDRDRYEGRRDDRGYRDDRQGQSQGQGQGRDRDRDRDRERGYRDDRPRDRDRFEGRDRYENRPREGGQDPMPVVEPEATPLTAQSGGEESGSHTLRSQDGGFSPAPAFLQARPEAPAGGEDAEPAPEPKRRRRAPRATEGAASSDES
jgi:hypothetical protein